ncbi:metallophosphoesterase family protein [Staphylococcus gallinarum]|uniref:metallophosphoesterase family protein n=1 Tax=Staphylococcus gallinarum TaxID=1293 RepID=UPI0030BC2BE2
MNYVFISDIHSNYDNLANVLKSIETSVKKPYKIICLGDIFEVKISKSEINDYIFNDIKEVIDDGFDIFEKLKNILIIRGNQEERLFYLIPDDKLPNYLNDLKQRLKNDFLISSSIKAIHGHQFRWKKYENRHYPVIKSDNYRVLFYGHSHENNIFKVKLKDHDCISYDRINIEYGSPYILDFNENTQYLINVGDLKESEINWVLYDSMDNSLTFYSNAN